MGLWSSAAARNKTTLTKVCRCYHILISVPEFCANGFLYQDIYASQARSDLKSTMRVSTFVVNATTTQGFRPSKATQQKRCRAILACDRNQGRYPNMASREWLHCWRTSLADSFIQKVLSSLALLSCGNDEHLDSSSGQCCLRLGFSHSHSCNRL